MEFIKEFFQKLVDGNLLIPLAIAFVCLVILLINCIHAAKCDKQIKALSDKIADTANNRNVVVQLAIDAPAGMQAIASSEDAEAIVCPAEPVATDTAPAVEEPAPEENAEADNDNNISFQAIAHKTLEEKYAELSDEKRDFYNQVAIYAAGIDGSKGFRNSRYEEYKIGRTRLVRLLIKRDDVICEFIMQNFEFKNYVKENDVDVKVAPTQIKLVDATSVQNVKDTINIVLDSIEKEKQYRKELAKQRRKQNRENA